MFLIGFRFSEYKCDLMLTDDMRLEAVKTRFQVVLNILKQFKN